MSKELIQKKFYIDYSAKISETKVSYKVFSFGEESEISIPYEQIFRNKESYVRDKFFLKVVSFIFGFFSIVSLIYRNDKDFGDDIWQVWTILFVISVSAYFITLEKLWKIPVQNGYLFFFKSSPDKESVNLFIDEIFKSRDSYLRDTYFFEINQNISYDSQIKNIQWLRQMEAISKSEFTTQKKQLDKIFSIEPKTIGYN